VLLKMLLKIVSPILCLVVLFQLTAGSPLSSYDEQMAMKKILNSSSKLKYVCHTAIRNFKVLIAIIIGYCQFPTFYTEKITK